MQLVTCDCAQQRCRVDSDDRTGDQSGFLGETSEPKKDASYEMRMLPLVFGLSQKI